jgi:hypothetical protein
MADSVAQQYPTAPPSATWERATAWSGGLSRRLTDLRAMLGLSTRTAR